MGLSPDQPSRNREPSNTKPPSHPKVAELIENWVKMEHSAMGVHGTSLETILEAFRVGFLPTRPDPSFSKAHDLAVSFYPNLRLFKDRGHPLIEGFTPEPGEYESGVETYANLTAARHFFNSSVGVRFEDLQQYAIACDLFDGMDYDERKGREARQALKDLVGIEISRDGLKHLYRDALLRKGVLILLSPDLIAEPGDMKILTGDDGEYDLTLFAPTGVDLRYLVGIKPLGNIESRILQSIS